MNEIICGNNIEVMKKMESNSVDLVVTSPPYDKMRTYKGFIYSEENTSKELFRIMTPGATLIYVIGDSTADGCESMTSFKCALQFVKTGFNLFDTMIYAKKGITVPSNVRYHQSFEYMFWFTKGKPKTFNPIKDRKNIWAGSYNWGKTTKRQADGSLVEGPRKQIAEYSMRGNIWEYSVGKGNSTRDERAYEHPAIFPEALAKDLITSFSNVGDVVLDPFNGSGTTTKMAQDLERKFIGIDISEEYCDIARSRLRDDVDGCQI